MFTSNYKYKAYVGMLFMYAEVFLSLFGWKNPLKRLKGLRQIWDPRNNFPLIGYGWDMAIHMSLFMGAVWDMRQLVMAVLSCVHHMRQSVIWAHHVQVECDNQSWPHIMCTSYATVRHISTSCTGGMRQSVMATYNVYETCDNQSWSHIMCTSYATVGHMSTS
jgi:hypothetical protein